MLVGLVRRVLERVVSGSLEASDGIPQVRAMYLDESALLGDLKAVAEMSDTETNERVIAAVREWLALHPSVR